MMALRIGEENPWISSAGGMPVDKGLESVQVPLRSRRDLVARILDLWGNDMLEGILLESRDVVDFTDGVDGGESSRKSSKSGSSGRDIAAVIEFLLFFQDPSDGSCLLIYEKGH